MFENIREFDVGKWCVLGIDFWLIFMVFVQSNGSQDPSEKLPKIEKFAIKVVLAQVCLFGKLLVWISERFGDDFLRIFGWLEVDLRADFGKFVDYSSDLFSERHCLHKMWYLTCRSFGWFSRFRFFIFFKSWKIPKTAIFRDPGRTDSRPSQISQSEKGKGGSEKGRARRLRRAGAFLRRAAACQGRANLKKKKG